MIKKTFEDLKKIDKIHESLLKVEGFKNTKLAYAFKRLTEKSLKDIFTEYHEAINDIKIDFALVDEKTKALLFNETNTDYQNSKEDRKKLLKKLKEVNAEWDKKEFEIEPFICNDLGDMELDQYDTEILKGVIIE